MNIEVFKISNVMLFEFKKKPLGIASFECQSHELDVSFYRNDSQIIITGIYEIAYGESRKWDNNEIEKNNKFIIGKILTEIRRMHEK